MRQDLLLVGVFTVGVAVTVLAMRIQSFSGSRTCSCDDTLSELDTFLAERELPRKILLPMFEEVGVNVPKDLLSLEADELDFVRTKLRALNLRRFNAALSSLNRQNPASEGGTVTPPAALAAPVQTAPAPAPSAGGAVAATGASSSDSASCSSADARFVLIHGDQVCYPEICEHELGWQLVRAGLPDARQFFDVGANLGYITARIFELWSPGDGLTSQGLYRKVAADGFRDPLGLCKDGNAGYVSLACADNAGAAECRRSAPINVTMFDGNKKFPINVTRVIAEHYRTVAPKTHYRHMALLDKPGEVSFSQEDTENGAIGQSYGPRPGTVEIKVPGSTVDLYLEQNGIAALDVLKIDAEGFDPAVLRGAADSLNRSLRFVTFEAAPLHISTVEFLDGHGFSCFLAGSKPAFIELTACLHVSAPPFRAVFKDDTSPLISSDYSSPRAWAGNAYCAHRRRAPALLKLFTEYSVKPGTYAKLMKGVAAETVAGSFMRSAAYRMSIQVNRCTDPPSKKCAPLAPAECRDPAVDFVCRGVTEAQMHADGCVDSAGWADECHTRFKLGYCVNGTVPAHLAWTIGKGNRYPERHCCICGKAAYEKQSAAG